MARAATLCAAAAAAAAADVVTYASLLRPQRVPPALAAAGSNYSLRVLDRATYPRAVCLDGSMAAYYYRAGAPADANKVRVFFQGGGWCTSTADCAARAKTPLGSNAALPATDADPAGYCGASFLSQDAAMAPGFATWPGVYVPYCTGDSLTGRADAPVPFNGTEIWYRGADSRDAILADMRSFLGVSAATDVLVGGCSAGGLTVYLNIDAIASALAPAKVRGVADAGFFLDHPDRNGAPVRTTFFQWGFAAWNSSASLSPACLAAYPAQQWKCIFAPYAAPYISTPVFALNSRFDSCQLNGCELDLPTVSKGWANMSPDDQAAAVDYAAAFMAAFAPFRANALNAGFIVSCLLHCEAGTANYNATLVANTAGGAAISPGAAVLAWYNGVTPAGGSWWVDAAPLPPSNPTC